MPSCAMIASASSLISGSTRAATLELLIGINGFVLNMPF
jgi:hypothetical protein